MKPANNGRVYQPAMKCCLPVRRISRIRVGDGHGVGERKYPGYHCRIEKPGVAFVVGRQVRQSCSPEPMPVPLKSFSITRRPSSCRQFSSSVFDMPSKPHNSIAFPLGFTLVELMISDRHRFHPHARHQFRIQHQRQDDQHRHGDVRCRSRYPRRARNALDGFRQFRGGHLMHRPSLSRTRKSTPSAMAGSIVGLRRGITATYDADGNASNGDEVVMQSSERERSCFPARTIFAAIASIASSLIHFENNSSNFTRQTGDATTYVGPETGSRGRG